MEGAGRKGEGDRERIQLLTVSVITMYYMQVLIKMEFLKRKNIGQL